MHAWNAEENFLLHISVTLKWIFYITFFITFNIFHPIFPLKGRTISNFFFRSLSFFCFNIKSVIQFNNISNTIRFCLLFFFCLIKKNEKRYNFPFVSFYFYFSKYLQYMIFQKIPEKNKWIEDVPRSKLKQLFSYIPILFYS